MGCRPVSVLCQFGNRRGLLRAGDALVSIWQAPFIFDRAAASFACVNS
jgi:hypothetical protein